MSPTCRLIATSVILAATVSLAGCGVTDPTKTASTPEDARDAAAIGKAAPEDTNAKGARAEKEAGFTGPDNETKPTAPIDRKIVYRATLEVIVPELEQVIPQVERLVAEHKGYVAKSEVRSDSGRRRTATFTLRVPVDVLSPVRASLMALGVPERDAIDSDDVTEEFVDVQARLKNYKEQEDKLNELLREKRKEEKLEDIIRVSDRIAEVRRDVERVQGRLNYLNNRISLATINLTLREVKNYQPPTAPTFSKRVSIAFSDSWDALVRFSQSMVLAGVGLLVWSPVIVPTVIVVRWVLRRRRAARLAGVTTAARATEPAPGS